MYVSLRLRAMFIPAIIIVLLLVVGTANSVFGVVKKTGSEEAVLTESKNTQADSNKLLIKIFLTDIQSITHDYYDSYIDIQPTVDFESISVERVYSDQSKDFVVFNCSPYVGAHNTIGIEEILFSADKQGSVRLVKFTHIKGFQLPEHLQNHVKNDYPFQQE